MSHDVEPAVLLEIGDIVEGYHDRWSHSMAELETHDSRIRQHPVVNGIPSVDTRNLEPVMVIPIKEDVTGEQVMDLVKGISMPVELVAGEEVVIQSPQQDSQLT